MLSNASVGHVDDDAASGQRPRPTGRAAIFGAPRRIRAAVAIAVTFSAPNLFGKRDELHQSQLPPEDNKFHAGNGEDGKHYWLTPPALYASLNARFNFDFDPCPYPLPEGFDGLTCGWGKSSYANIPFGSIMHKGPNDKKAKKKGPTAWVRKALAEQAKGKRVVMVYPVDKWLLMLLAAGAKVENLGDVRWCATEDGSVGKGTGRHIACFILEPSA
jgi:hypothetical protein